MIADNNIWRASIEYLFDSYWEKDFDFHGKTNFYLKYFHVSLLRIYSKNWGHVNKFCTKILTNTDTRVTKNDFVKIFLYLFYAETQKRSKKTSKADCRLKLYRKLHYQWLIKIWTNKKKTSSAFLEHSWLNNLLLLWDKSKK